MNEECELTQRGATLVCPSACVIFELKLKTKLRGLSPHANYTDRAAAAGRRS